MILNPAHFGNLGDSGRIWAVSAIDGHTVPLHALHNEIWRQFKPGDKLIYLGHYLANPARDDNPDAIDSVILFKNALIEHGRAQEGDIICLKGAREHMWQKLLQLHFANRPIEVLEWLLKNGMEGLLHHYGSNAHEARSAARSGVIALTRWTSDLRYNMRAKGHDEFYNGLKRAAYTSHAKGFQNLLFVHAGLDPARPLHAQHDSFWWETEKFETLSRPYGDFKYIIRGHDPRDLGCRQTRATVTLSSDPARNGLIACGRFTEFGTLSEVYLK